MENNKKSFAVATWIISVFVLGYLIHTQSVFFIWICCSFLLFVLIDPLYLKLRSQGYSSSVTAILLVLLSTLLVGLVITGFVYISNDVYIELENSKKVFIEYYNLISGQIKELLNSFKMYQSGDAKLVQKVQVIESSPLSENMSHTLVSGVSNIMNVIVYVLLWPILTYFMLAEYDIFSKAFSKLFTNPEQAKSAWQNIVTAVRAYFWGNLVLLIVTIPLFQVLFLFFSIENFFTLSILAAIINIIPFIGAVLTGIIPALQVLGQSHDPFAAIWVYAFCLVIHFLMANFITPKLLGSKVNLNATTSTIALMAWSLIWGSMGLILAIPVTAIINILCAHSNHETMKWFSYLMSENKKTTDKKINFKKMLSSVRLKK